MVAGCFRGSPFHVFITHLAHLFPLILSVTLLFSFHFVSTLSITPFSLLLSYMLFLSSSFLSLSFTPLLIPPPPSLSFSLPLSLQLAYVGAILSKPTVCLCAFVCVYACVFEQMCQHAFLLYVCICVFVFVLFAVHVQFDFGDLCVCSL